MNNGGLWLKEIKRRTFLQAAGTVAAAVALGSSGCSLPTIDKTLSPPEAAVNVASQGNWYPSGCSGCTSWCAKEVYVVNGRAIKVRGNSFSKVHRENGCLREHMMLQQVYDPDRIKVPMKRTNPQKGRHIDPAFVPISWDEAIGTIADKLLELRQNNETHKLLVMRGRYTQLNAILYDRFAKIMGSPNNISHSSICAEAEKFGPFYTEGYWNYKDYDVANTRMIVLWGCDPLSAHRQVSHYLSAWGDILDQAEVVVVDPRLSTSAAKSNLWLPIRPGEDGALAIGLAHLILVEGLWSREFVGDFNDGTNRFIAGETVDEDTFTENYTHGLVQWWNLELKDKTPAWAAERTGLPLEKIVRVARRLGELAPQVMLWPGGGPSMQVRGAYNSLAISAINGLLGATDSMGGTIRGDSPPRQSLPGIDDFLDDLSAAGVKYPKIDQRGYKEFPALNSGRSGGGVLTNRVADAILAEDPYDIKMAIGYWNNFNFSCPQPDRWDRAMEKVPFFVHSVTHASEMTMFADIVLPSTQHMIEQWGYHAQKGNAHTHLWMTRPLIDPVWDCKNPETDVVWLLAHALAERGFSNLLDFCLSFKDPETGASPSNEAEFSEYALKLNLQPIWDPDKYSSGDRFQGWEDFKARGIWNSPPYNYKKYWDNFGTATGRFEFYSETLKEALESHAARHNTTVDDILETCKYTARGETAFIPHYEEPYIWGDSPEFKLVMVDHKSKVNREGRSANCSWYYEFKDVDPGDEKWADVARINPADAALLGIAEGDAIRIISSTGKMRCTAKLWEGVPPGTLGKTFGQGHHAYGRVAATAFQTLPRGSNNNEVIPADYERLSGSTAFYGVTRVRVEKITESEA